MRTQSKERYLKKLEINEKNFEKSKPKHYKNQDNLANRIKDSDFNYKTTDFCHGLKLILLFHLK